MLYMNHRKSGMSIRQGVFPGGGVFFMIKLHGVGCNERPALLLHRMEWKSCWQSTSQAQQEETH